MSASFLPCFDIGGSGIKLADVDARLGVGPVRQVATPTRCLQAFSSAIETVLADHGADEVAIAIAGVIDPSSGTLRCANIPAIDGIALGEHLSSRLGRRIHLLNDADAFALACARAAEATGTVFAAIIGTGIGGGVVIDGRLLQGARGSAGEWGHQPAVAMRTGVALPLLRCNCGQLGCVDTLCGARGLETLHRYLHAGDARQAGQDSRGIVDAWRSGDPTAGHTVQVWLDITAGALVGVVNVIDPALVLVGGGLGGDADLMRALDRELCARVLGQPPATLLRGAEVSSRQAMIGAALFARAAREPGHAKAG